MASFLEKNVFFVNTNHLGAMTRLSQLIENRVLVLTIVHNVFVSNSICRFICQVVQYHDSQLSNTMISRIFSNHSSASQQQTEFEFNKGYHPPELVCWPICILFRFVWRFRHSLHTAICLASLCPLIQGGLEHSIQTLLNE